VEGRLHDLTPELCAKLRDWLVGHERKCPQCGASGESMDITSLVDVNEARPRPGYGIDLDEIHTQANLKCRKCGNDRLIFEDIAIL
jgi:ribosomal protein S27AE